MNLEEAKTIITLVSAIFIPLVLAFVGHNYTQAQKERDIQAQFVKIAVEILQAPPTPENRNVRDWATQIINKYSGVPLSGAAQKDLVESTPINSVDWQIKYAFEKVPKSDLTQIQEDLKLIGLYKGEISGNADEETVRAIMAFQKQNGLAADGALGPQTSKKIRDAAAAIRSNN